MYPDFDRQLEDTDKAFAEIVALDVPRIRDYNKIDHVSDRAVNADFVATRLSFDIASSASDTRCLNNSCAPA